MIWIWKFSGLQTQVWAWEKIKYEPSHFLKLHLHGQSLVQSTFFCYCYLPFQRNCPSFVAIEFWKNSGSTYKKNIPRPRGQGPGSLIPQESVSTFRRFCIYVHSKLMGLEYQGRIQKVMSCAVFFLSVVLPSIRSLGAKFYCDFNQVSLCVMVSLFQIH